MCNYCKQSRHIIKECPIRPPSRASRNYATANSAVVVTSGMHSVSTAPDTQPPVLNKEMVQEMILSAFSTLGLQGNVASSTSSWVLDSGATNHMTNSL